MKNKNKIFLTFALSSTVLASLLTINILNKDDYSVNAFEFSSEYFLAENMNVFTNKSIPISTGIKDYRNGVLLSSDKNGAKVTLKDEMSGTFTIDMLSYSQSAFSGNDYEASSYSNQYQDLNTISLTFKDLDNENNSFKLVLNGGANGNNVTVNAHVEANNEKMGIHYLQDSEELGNTNGANANDVYTFLYGTSFSNVAVHNGIYSSSNVKSLQLEFDPHTMCVYGYSYGYRTDKVSKVLIWDFTKSSIDGSLQHTTLQGFDKYQVSLSFDSLNSKKTGNVMIYEINGQKFSNTLINNNAGPQTHVKLNDGITNQKFILPTPTSYDVLDGNIDFNGTVEVYDEKGNKVDIYDNSNTLINNSKFTENCYFTPASAGKYSICYQAKDLANVAGDNKTYYVNVQDENEVVFNNTLARENYVTTGTTFNIPVVTATCKNNTYNTTVEVLDPSFNSIKINDSLSLANDGLYTIKFKATINNQEYIDELKVYASGESLSLFNKNNSNSIEYKTSSLNNDISGLIVNASLENSTITYKQELDVSLLDGETNLISLLALPSSWGKVSNTTLTVKLIDANDATNYVQVIATEGNKCDTSFVRAGSSNQKLAGLANDGTVTTLATSGTEILHSFTGQARYKQLIEQTFDVYFDYADKKIYTSSHSLVSDLDDSEFYTTSWDGFKGDKFILQVTCSGLNASETNYLVKNVAGYDVTKSHYIDNVAPVAVYDENDFSKGAVNKKYPLPEVGVKDNYSTFINSEVKVYKNNTEIQVVDNAFIPTSIGQYIISYKYTDEFGNENEFIKRIQIIEAIEELNIELEDKVVAGFVGSEITIPEYYVNGGEGKKTITITAKGKSTNIIYEVENLIFIPLVADEYVVTYNVKDRLGNVDSISTDISVIISDKPIISTPSFIPKALIDNKETVFAQVTAKDYNNKEKLDVEVEMFVEINGKQVKLDSLSYTPSIKELNSVAILTYKATSSITNKSSTLTYEIPVIRLYDDNEVLHLSQYLLTNNFDNVTSYDTYIDLTTTKNNASMEFIKNVYAHGFQLSFNIPANANNVASISIYLTDTNDFSKQVKLDIIKGNPADTFSYLVINNGERIPMVGTFYGTTAARLKIAYDNSLYSIKDDSGVDIAYIKDYSNGNVFKGFSSEINFKVVLNDVTGIATFRLYEIGNQIMSSVDDDYTVPSITLDGEIVRQAKINDTVIVPNAEAYDILGFKTKISIRVTDPDTNVIYQTNDGIGTTIKLEKYGTYYVSYNASDERGNPMTYSRTITVLDDISPIITLNGQVQSIANLNEKVILPSISVTDNITSEENIHSGIILEGPDSSFTYLTENEFIPTIAGKYIIRYYAVDEAGNIVYQDYVMEVN